MDVEVDKEMYSTIVVDCQTKTDTPNCEDCIAKKTCIARLQSKKQTEQLDLNAIIASDIFLL